MAKTKKRDYKLRELEEMAMSLVKHMDVKGVVGFSIAWNYRTILDKLGEYLKVKDELVKKYGKPIVGSNGEKTGEYVVAKDSNKYNDYVAEFTPIADSVVSIDVMTVKQDDVISVDLSASDILKIMWMVDFDDEDK